MSTRTRSSRVGTFSTIGIVFTTLSIVLVVAGAVAIYFYHGRRTRGRGTTEAEQVLSPAHYQQQPSRESRLKSIWILVRGHRRWRARGDAASSVEEGRSMSAHNTEVMSRSQSCATSMKGDAIEIPMRDTDVIWPATSPRGSGQQLAAGMPQHTPLSISLEIRRAESNRIDSSDQHHYPEDAPQDAPQDALEAAPSSGTSSSRDKVNEVRAVSSTNSNGGARLYPQRPPLAAKHSINGSTLSIPRIVFGGSAFPTRLNRHQHRNNDQSSDSACHQNITGGLSRPAPLSRNASDAPSLADSIPRTVTPMEEPEEEELMAPARTTQREDGVVYR